MAFMSAKTDVKSIKESTGGGNYINKSGMYSVIIERASVSTSKKGALSVDISLLNEAGNSTMFYNNIIRSIDGSDKDKNGKMLSGVSLINKIMIVNDIASISDPVEQIVKVGKDKKEIKLNVLEDLTDCTMMAQIQEEYSIIPEGFNNAGDIRQHLSIRTVFASDSNASAEELVAQSQDEDVELGSQFKTIKEHYANKVTYRDGLTAEDVAAWKNKKQNSNSEKPDVAATTAKLRKTGSLFS